MLNWSAGLSEFFMQLGLPEVAAIGVTYFIGALVLASIGPWFAAGLISVVAGGVLGNLAVQEMTDDPAHRDATGEEEREVFVPQQPHYFKP